MARITEISLRDIRCFEGEQSARLGRITLLVGENSAGKSTFLGCFRTFATLANLDNLEDKNHFDEPPFFMGPFHTIVRLGKTDFSIGGRFEGHCHTCANFSFSVGDHDEPLEREVELTFNGTEGTESNLQILWPSTESDVLRIKGPNFVFDLDRSEISYIPISKWLSQNIRRGFLPFRGDLAEFRKRKGSVVPKEVVEFVKFISFFISELPLSSRASFMVEAIDPALYPRQRYYVPTPPYLEDEEKSALVTEAGKKLGLWKGITVQRASEDRGTEVLIETVYGTHNLIDVGYGIHSLLPLLQATCPADPPKVFLLQQPEIHVHPISQAKLAQYLAESEHDYIIETHSEHFLDRFRILVMEGVLQPEEVVVLYFDSSYDRTRSQMYNIGVDEQGNLLDVPDGYRSFFLRETERLMGFKRLGSSECV